jgi:hypothetical protein
VSFVRFSCCTAGAIIDGSKKISKAIKSSIKERHEFETAFL